MLRESDSCCVVVFGRRPEAGVGKTRLAAGVGEEAAELAYSATLEHTLRECTASGLRTRLSLAQPAPAGWCPPVPVAVDSQCEGELGRRLAAAFESRFEAGDQKVVVVGSDCPALASHHLVQACSRLNSHPVVLGPAVDGGYWLVAQTAPGAGIFEQVPWSSPRTLAATHDRLRDLGLTWAELDELRDLDTVEDLLWYANPGEGHESLVYDLKRALLAAADAAGVAP